MVLTSEWLASAMDSQAFDWTAHVLTFKEGKRARQFSAAWTPFESFHDLHERVAAHFKLDLSTYDGFKFVTDTPCLEQLQVLRETVVGTSLIQNMMRKVKDDISRSVLIRNTRAGPGTNARLTIPFTIPMVVREQPALFEIIESI